MSEESVMPEETAMSEESVMPEETAMAEDLDPELLREFASVSESTADEAFMARTLEKIEGARRARIFKQALAGAAVAIIILLNSGEVLEHTGAAMRLAGELTSKPGEVLSTPWGGVLSMLVGAWVVFRTRPSRR